VTLYVAIVLPILTWHVCSFQVFNPFSYYKILLDSSRISGFVRLKKEDKELLLEKLGKGEKSVTYKCLQQLS
jgi:hypothetical protein